MLLETSEGVNYSRNSWLIYLNLDSMRVFVSFRNAGKLLKFEFWKTYRNSYFNFGCPSQIEILTLISVARHSLLLHNRPISDFLKSGTYCVRIEVEVENNELL